MIGTFPNFIFSGWASYEQIIQTKFIKDLGWGPTYTLTQNELNKKLSVI